MLKNLKIRNYRGLENLVVEDLKQVNLIVGKNSVGKTSLLESIYLLSNEGRGIRCLIDILIARQEVSTEFISVNVEEQRLYHAGHIFSSHVLNDFECAFISANDDQIKKLEIIFTRQSQDFSLEDAATRFAGIPVLNSEGVGELPSPFSISLRYNDANSVPAIPCKREGSITQATLKVLGQYRPQYFSDTDVPILYKSLWSGESKALTILWDRIELTDKEELVLSAIRAIEPRIKRLSFTGVSNFTSPIKAQLSGHEFPVPLGSLGDGIRQLLELSLLAVSAENSIMLVDDIDIGLHYQTQILMWKALLSIAKKLGIQIFATTHSWDCISALNEALVHSDMADNGKLIRLTDKSGTVKSVAYDAQELAVAVQQEIEVR